MCLHVYKSRNIKKPLIVYVVRWITGRRNTVIRSPFNGGTIWIVDKNKIIKNQKKYKFEMPKRVGVGHFHSFVSFGGAKKLHWYLSNRYISCNFAIYEAKILPSKIYIGKFDSYYYVKRSASIGSTNLTLIRKIGE